MKTSRRHPFIAAALAAALAATIAQAQTDSGYYRPFTLAPAEPAEGGGGGADDAAELAKKRNYAEQPDGGPEWGLRFTITLLFPKKG